MYTIYMMLLFWIFCDILSLNVKMYLWLKLYTVPFFVSGQIYKISKGSNNYCSHCTVPVKRVETPCIFLSFLCFISSVCNQTIHMWSKCRSSDIMKPCFYTFWFHHLLTTAHFIHSAPFQCLRRINILSNKIHFVACFLHAMTSWGLWPI